MSLPTIYTESTDKVHSDLSHHGDDPNTAQDLENGEAGLGKANGNGIAVFDFEANFSRLKRKTSPVKLVWSNILYSVNGKGDKKKVILNKISGEANPREVVALMGPSGSGKTTLLNVLAGRITGSGKGKSLTGVVMVNDHVINPVAFRRKVAYVTQEDALFATATAREALDFSAHLRLPKTTTKADRKRLVDDMIASLGLTKCEDTMVGSELIKGLSGGERKRVAIGVEIVSNPVCLFLDEPTSGLDSYSALNVVRILKAISATGCTTICSIHQPSSEVFNMFDGLVLLGSGGNVIYQGPVLDIDEPFHECGFAIPPRTNVADHIMLLAQTQPLEKLPQDNENRRRYGGRLPPSSSETQNARSTFGSMIASVTGSLPFMEVTDKDEEVKPNWWIQSARLSTREFRSIYRDKATLIGRFGGTIFLNVLFAIVFLHAADQTQPKYTVNSAFGALVQIFIGGLFGAAQPAILTFPLERIVFIRERATATYATVPYVFAKLLVELPISFFASVLTMIISYWAIGFNGDFFLLTLSLWALMLAATSTAYVLGSVVSTPKSALELAPLVLVPQILFLGLFIRIEQIPVWLRWVQYLCATKYAINLAMLVEFDPDLAINAINRKEFEDLLSFNAVSASQTWLYAFLLLTIFVGFRLISLIVLNERAKRF